MTHSLDQALIQSWQLKGSDFDAYGHEVLGPLLLDYGLLAPWRYLSLKFELDEIPFSSEQQQYAFDISNNAQSLLAELIALGDQCSLKDQLRILGLLCVLISSGAEIPAATTKQIVVSRDALDLFSLACINSRSHELANLVSMAVNSADNSSRGLDLLTSYLGALLSPLNHRHRVISKQRLLDLSPWREMTDVLVGLRTCAELMHDRKYGDAESRIAALLLQYPNCPEVTWLANTYTFYVTHSPPWQLQSDPLAFYHSDPFTSSSLNILDQVLARPTLLSACYQIINSFNCGFDPGLTTHAYSCLINQSYQAGKHDDSISLINKNSDDIIGRSSYDPFDLALFASQLSDLDNLASPNPGDPTHDSPLDIIFVVGLPHICWFDLEKKLHQRPNIATMMSHAVVEHIGTRLAELHKDGSPAMITHTSANDLAELHTFYLQNLSFVHGGKTVDFIIDLIPNSFRHIGPLSKIFPAARFVALNFSVEDLVLYYLTTINGFNSRHATATLGELVAYALDYANIMNHWKSLLPDRMSFLALDSSLSAETLAEHAADAIHSFAQSGMPPSPLLGQVGCDQICSDLTSLSTELLEYEDDMAEIRQLLFAVN